MILPNKDVRVVVWVLLTLAAALLVLAFFGGEL